MAPVAPTAGPPLQSAYAPICSGMITGAEVEPKCIDARQEKRLSTSAVLEAGPTVATKRPSAVANEHVDSTN